MNYTTNYQLNKPERNEQFNLDDWNENSDAIDAGMHANEVNILANTNNISAILTGLSTKNVSDANSIYFKLMKLVYPVGSIYWSGNSTNPATLFGGTWTQIKDKFIWAKGDSDTLGATGGAKTITLTVDNLPSHNHSFTPSGSVAVTSNPTFSGSSTSTGGMNRNSQGNIRLYDSVVNYSRDGNISVVSGYFSGSSASLDEVTNTSARYALRVDVNHEHSFTPSGSISGGAYSFTGTAGTTGSKGSGTAVNKMPPYVVKYCWERTA